MSPPILRRRWRKSLQDPQRATGEGRGNGSQ